jgi:hypothetical protein
MIALSAPAVQGNRLAAILVDNVSQPLRDFRDRHVPLDFIEAAIGATAQRGREPIPVMRIIGNPGRFVAQIAL